MAKPCAMPGTGSVRARQENTPAILSCSTKMESDQRLRVGRRDAPSIDERFCRRIRPADDVFGTHRAKKPRDRDRSQAPERGACLRKVRIGQERRETPGDVRRPRVSMAGHQLPGWWQLPKEAFFRQTLVSLRARFTCRATAAVPLRPRRGGTCGVGIVEGLPQSRHGILVERSHLRQGAGRRNADLGVRVGQRHRRRVGRRRSRRPDGGKSL